MIPGLDHIGVGVGAAVFDGRGRVFFARRGENARNERGVWELPGGMVGFGERLQEALKREFDEEFGMAIEPVGLLGVFDHLLPDEGQHWVSATFVARHAGGEPRVREPGKCSEIGWFGLTGAPAPLSVITRENLRALHSGGCWAETMAAPFRDASS